MAARGKLLAGLLALPVLGYGAACSWMYAKQRDLMYFPQATRADAAQTDEHGRVGLAAAVDLVGEAADDRDLLVAAAEGLGARARARRVRVDAFHR